MSMSKGQQQGHVEEGGQHQHPTAPMTISSSKKPAQCSIEISHCCDQKDEDSQSGQSVTQVAGSPGSASSIERTPEEKQIAAEEWQRERRLRAFRGGWKTGDDEHGHGQHGHGGHSPGHAHGHGQCSSSISPS